MKTPVNSRRPYPVRNAKNTDPIGITRLTGTARLERRKGPTLFSSKNEGPT